MGGVSVQSWVLLIAACTLACLPPFSYTPLLSQMFAMPMPVQLGTDFFLISFAASWQKHSKVWIDLPSHAAFAHHFNSFCIFCSLSNTKQRDYKHSPYLFVHPALQKAIKKTDTNHFNWILGQNLFTLWIYETFINVRRGISVFHHLLWIGSSTVMFMSLFTKRVVFKG